MKLRIVNPRPMGLFADHAGKEYEVETVGKEYRIKALPHLKIREEWIKAGYAEKIAEGCAWPC